MSVKKDRTGGPRIAYRMLPWLVLGFALSGHAALAQSTRLTLSGTASNFYTAPDTNPNPFSFTPLTGLSPDGYPVQSNQITVTGINTPTPISVSDMGTGSDPRVRINGLAGVTSGTVSNGDKVVVSVIPQAGAYDTTYRAAVTIGDVTAPFVVTTRALDLVPAAFTFTAANDVEPGTVNTSNAVTLTGFDQPVTATLSSTAGSAEYRIGSGAWIPEGTSSSVSAGNTVQLRLTAGAFDEARSATLTVGGVSASYAVTARSADATPESFTFPPYANIAPDTQIVSDPIVLSGFDASLTLTLTGAEGSPEYRIDGGSWTPAGTPAQVTAGNTVEVRMFAGPLDATRTAVLAVGTTQASFTLESETSPDACETGAVGAVCEDGAIYAGVYNGIRIYLAPADEAGTFQQTSSLVSGASGTEVAAIGTTDGIYNTDFMAKSPSLFPAAAACRAKGDDWFLPAAAAINTISGYVNVGTIPQDSFTSALYWSSTQITGTTTGGITSYPTGASRNLITKAYTASNWATSLRVRCARPGPAPSTLSFTTPAYTQYQRSTLATSGDITISGFVRPETLSVSGDGSPQISVSGGAWETSAKVGPSDTVRIRLMASSSANTTSTATVKLGTTVVGSFSVTTETGADCLTGPVGTRCESDNSIYVGTTSQGHRLYMASTTEGPLAWKTTNTATGVTLNGTFNATATSVTDGLPNTNILMAADGSLHPAAQACRDKGDAWYLPSPNDLTLITNNRGQIPSWAIPDQEQYIWTSQNNATAAIYRKLSSTSNVTSGARTDLREVRCVRNDATSWTTSGSLSLTALTNQTRNTLVESSQVLISGLRNPNSVSISVSGDGSPQISIAGGPWVTSGMIQSAQPVKVRLRTSSSYDTTSTATISIGGTISTFSASTAGDCATGAVGTVCEDDGAIYGGTNAAGERMYMWSADESVLRWKTTTTSTAGATSLTDGKANMTAIQAAGISSHPAAQVCANKGPGWYLPSVDEIDRLFLSGALTGTTRRWASSEIDAATADHVNAADSIGRTKTSTSIFRCIRN